MPNREDEDALVSLAFALHTNPGAYALLLGAGVSAPAIKSAWRVLEDLCGRLALLHEGHDVDDPISWYQETYGREVRYGPVIEQVALLPTERQRLLADYFIASPDEIDAGQKVPTPAHHAIARLVASGSVRVIVTMNFDRLMEQALREAGIEPTVIASAADAEAMAPLHTLSCCVIHLHGDFMSPTSMLNTDTELGTYDDRIATVLHQVLREYGLVVAGWSAEHDTALRNAVAAHYPDRYTLTWIEPSNQGHLAAELLALKRGVLLRATADDAFVRIAEAVHSLATRNARHPLTVPVAVETAKRELGGGRVAISVHDTLGQAFADLHAHPDFTLPDYQSADAYGGYDAMFERTDEAARLPAALVSTLAYWGDSASDGWWLTELPRFATQRHVGGSTAVIKLRHVAGVALLYSAGIAAVAARRWSLLRDLFELTAPDPYNGGRRRLTSLLSPDNAYFALRGGGAAVYPRIGRRLEEHLGLGRERLDDAWQKFEILRLSHLALKEEIGPRQLAEFETLNTAVVQAESALEATRKAGRADADDRLALDQARAAYQRAVVENGQHRNPGCVHVVSADSGFHSHRSPVAEQLANEVDAEGETHPFVAAGLFGRPTRAVHAIRLVSAGIGRAGASRAWDLAEDGVIPHAVWLDIDEIPDLYI